jgi:methyltransferase
MGLLAYAIVVFVALQRLCELVHASRNTRALEERGAIEVGRGHYPAMVLLHVSWLIAMAVGIHPDVVIRWPLMVLFIGLQVIRLWVIVTLGPYWTTRIVTLPDAPLARKGPYRFCRHPNYVVVAGELAVLPLVFGQTIIAIIFTVLNACVLAWRIRVEDVALAPRRRYAAHGCNRVAGPDRSRP